MKLFLKISGILLLIILCIEIALQIYNPFTSRIKNGKIILPINTKYELKLPNYYGMDSFIVHTKNSLGFRGPELTDSVKTKIICIGGSTTECFYLNDGKDWPNVLGDKFSNDNKNIWLNNAGMDGQSSFGHLKLLKKHIIPLKPDYIILMCGLNDMSLDTPARFDESKPSFLQKIYNTFELPSTIRNIIRAGKAKEAGLNHQFFENLNSAETFEMSDSSIEIRLKKEQKYILGYEKRIGEIISLCKKNKIKLIFVSQSILFSDETDLFTNVYLGNLKTGDINGKTRSYISKMYNRSTYKVATQNNLPFINLTARLPKDSRFFYDGYHFTNDGAEIAAGIIYDEIQSKKSIPELKNAKN
jgi:lysophospholipase L1-like esterase